MHPGHSSQFRGESMLQRLSARASLILYGPKLFLRFGFSHWVTLGEGFRRDGNLRICVISFSSGATLRQLKLRLCHAREALA